MLRHFPLNFALYTNDCWNQHTNNYIMKFSDDTAVLAVLESDIAGRTSEIEEIEGWFEKHNKIFKN